ncbi:MAG: MBG domain-containing protein, partial [bacterium]
SDFGLTYNLTGNPVNAGTYNNVIVPSALSGAKSINYNITYQNGDFVIDQKALTVKANDTNKTYGDANPAFNSTFTGLASSDSTSDFGLTYNLTGNPVNAGTYNNAIVPSALSGAHSGNYTVTYQNGDFVIDQKALTVKANNNNKTYGDANPAFNSTFTGLASSDNTSDFGLTYNLTGNPVNAGTYNNAIVPSALSGAKSINYNITYQNGDFVIDQKALTVKANNANKTYGDANPAFNSTFTGLASSDNTSDFGLTYNLTGNPVNAGTYNNAIIPSALSGAKSINYSITYQNGDFVIDQKALTVKANNTNKTYGDANPAFTASYTGFISGEDQTVLGGAIGYTTAATNTSSVNNYAISPSGLTSLNYNIAFTNGTLTVLPKGLTVKANNANKTYGDANPQFSATYEGFITGQDKSVLGGSLSFSTSANNYSPAGNYTVTPLGLTSTNYTIEFTNGNLVINPKIVPTVVIADIIDPIIPIKKDIANDIQFRKYDYATLDEISNNIKYSNNEIPTIKNISNQMQIENKDTVNQPIFNDTKNNKKFTWE